MSFTNRLSTISNGFGTPIQNDSSLLRTGVSLSGTSGTAVAIPSTGSLSPTVSKGLVRIKVYTGGGTSPTLVNVLVTGTDGTSTVTLASFDPTTAVSLGTNDVVDLTFGFICDLDLTSVTVTPTLGGTSPTASADVELSPTI